MLLWGQTSADFDTLMAKSKCVSAWNGLEAAFLVLMQTFSPQLVFIGASSDAECTLKPQRSSNRGESTESVKNVLCCSLCRHEMMSAAFTDGSETTDKRKTVCTSQCRAWTPNSIQNIQLHRSDGEDECNLSVREQPRTFPPVKAATFQQENCKNSSESEAETGNVSWQKKPAAVISQGHIHQSEPSNEQSLQHLIEAPNHKNTWKLHLNPFRPHGSTTFIEKWEPSCYILKVSGWAEHLIHEEEEELLLILHEASTWTRKASTGWVRFSNWKDLQCSALLSLSSCVVLPT